MNCTQSKPEEPEVRSSQGLRVVEGDPCLSHDPCMNEGRCVNIGGNHTHCDCDRTSYDGSFCNAGKNC